MSLEFNAVSQFLYPTPKPNPVPIHNGNALRLKNNSETTEPIRKPPPVAKFVINLEMKEPNVIYCTFLYNNLSDVINFDTYPLWLEYLWYNDQLSFQIGLLSTNHLLSPMPSFRILVLDFCFSFDRYLKSIELPFIHNQFSMCGEQFSLLYLVDSSGARSAKVARMTFSDKCHVSKMAAALKTRYIQMYHATLWFSKLGITFFVAWKRFFLENKFSWKRIFLQTLFFKTDLGFSSNILFEDFFFWRFYQIFLRFGNFRTYLSTQKMQI